MIRSRTVWLFAGAAVVVASAAAAWLASSRPAPSPPLDATRAAPVAPASKPAPRATSRAEARERAAPPQRERVDPSPDDPRRVRAPEKSKPVTDAPTVAVVDAPPDWTPTAARAVAETWRPVRKTTVVHGRGDSTVVLTPPAATPDASGGAALLVRVVDDLGDGVPGAVVSVRSPGKAGAADGKLTTGPEGLVARRFDASGRYDVGLEEAPEGWLTRTAEGFVPSVLVMFDAAGDERIVEARMTVARAARLEIDVSGASVRPRESGVRLAGLGVERDDGALVWNNFCAAAWDGDRVISWKRLPAGPAYEFVNVNDVGTAGVWCRLEAGRTTRARLDLATDGTSLVVRVPASKTSAKFLVASVLQLADSIVPPVWRTKSFVRVTPDADTFVEFRNLAAGRYVVRAGFQEGRSFRPVLAELRRGENQLALPPIADEVETVDVPIVWARRADGGWQCPLRPTLIVFAPEAAPGPRVALSDVVDWTENRVRAPTGLSDVLVLQQPGAWFNGGANYRFLRLDVPGTTTFEPDRQ